MGSRRKFNYKRFEKDRERWCTVNMNLRKKPECGFCTSNT